MLSDGKTYKDGLLEALRLCGVMPEAEGKTYEDGIVDAIEAISAPAPESDPGTVDYINGIIVAQRKVAYVVRELVGNALKADDEKDRESRLDAAHGAICAFTELVTLVEKTSNDAGITLTGPGDETVN